MIYSSKNSHNLLVIWYSSIQNSHPTSKDKERKSTVFIKLFRKKSRVWYLALPITLLHGAAITTDTS
jgi:hypothetical protein